MPVTVGTPGFMIPAFSPAISASVSPSISRWSSEIEVMAQAVGTMTLVASPRPPKPTSSTQSSAGFAANSTKAAAVMTSNTVIGAPAFTCSMCSSVSANVSSVTSAPAMRKRSLKRTRWGEV